MIGGSVATRSQTRQQTEPRSPQISRNSEVRTVNTMATTSVSTGVSTTVTTTVVHTGTMTVPSSIASGSIPIMHPALRGMPLPTCPNFDHTSTDPMNWLAHYELYASNYNVAQDKMLFQLPLFLDREAKQWYNTLQPSEKQTWANFSRAFEARWHNANPLERLNKLSGLTQAPGQPVREFITRFQHEARSLNLSDNQILPMLYEKISPTLRPDILRKSPNTVHEFISAAVSAEQILASNPLESGSVNLLQTLLNQQLPKLVEQLAQTQVSSLHAPDAVNVPKVNCQPFLAQPHQHATTNRDNGNRNHRGSGYRKFAQQGSAQRQGMPPNRQTQNANRSNQSRQSDNKCYSCGGRGHIKRDCPNRYDDCYRCGQTGHSPFACPSQNQSH